MSRGINTPKQMPVGGSFTVNSNPQGKPQSTSSIKYGEDLRAGNGKSK